MTIFCATTNPGKLAEFRRIVAAHSGGRIGVEPLDGIENTPPPEETGGTFEENAIAKALAYGALTGGYLFVDDSGLEVDALGGAPGVHSARYAGEDASDAANNRLLVERMRGADDRAARFVCVVALAEGGRLAAAFRGVVEGRLLEEPSGASGFGYDPLFYYPAFGCSFGEVSAERKAEVSHRGRALRGMVTWLLERGWAGQT